MYKNLSKEILQNIIPKIEQKIRKEILALVHEELKKQNRLNSDNEKELFEEYYNVFLKKLGVETLNNFFELEFLNINAKFKKYFPFDSFDHFIENTLKETFSSIGKAKKELDFDNNENLDG